MGAVIRQCTAQDAVPWAELFNVCMGDDYPERQVYDLGWVAERLSTPGGDETWAAEAQGRLVAAVSLLEPSLANRNPITNLGREIFRPESLKDGSAQGLLNKITQLSESRKQVVVARVFASDNARQALFEQSGFVCVGFQPFKHMLRTREGVLFYLRQVPASAMSRLPISESLSQVSELATTVLANLKVTAPLSVRDGVTGYPLQRELQYLDATLEEYKETRLKAESFNPPVEISGGFNLGWGAMRVSATSSVKALLAKVEDAVVAGLAFAVDDRDRCVRLVDGFATDDLSMGAAFQRVVKLAQEKHNAVYIEADLLMTAPRLLKCTEQLGFVPVAYLPGFYSKGAACVDVVKLVKLNMAYGLESAKLTTHAKTIADIVDRNFQDQKVGVAIINLLRGLPVFEGLGDGELRKIARLFTQKLFRPNDRIFSKGDSGSEAYIVMRGQVDIVLEEGGKPLASLGTGQIFGEQAFLDGAPRGALALASQPSILLVVQRTAFNELVQREPHLGMVVMRNIALTLSNRLRRSTTPPGAKA
jgi:hypothetical protein